MWLRTACIALAILAGSSAFAQAGRYELVPEPEVRQMSTNRVASAYVIDKKANQFWSCTARYNFQDLTANNGTVSGSRPISADHRSPRLTMYVR
jgi:hypothetical protein